MEELLGKIDPTDHSGFSEIPIALASRKAMWLRTLVLDAFSEMKDAAKKDGIDLKIISATRTFGHQKRIWEAKWNGTRKVDGQSLNQTISDPKVRARKILEYSSMPGTSRHHWGTDIDINSLDPDYFRSGRGKKEYEWLRDHAFEFGFCQTYTQKDSDRPVGYEMEDWHWSYFPISAPMLAAYKNQVDKESFGGFDGDSALPFNAVMEYVFGISSKCE